MCRIDQTSETNISRCVGKHLKAIDVASRALELLKTKKKKKIEKLCENRDSNPEQRHGKPLCYPYTILAVTKICQGIVYEC